MRVLHGTVRRADPDLGRAAAVAIRGHTKSRADGGVPHKNVYPKHLDNFLVSRKGQFLLEPLPGGRTRLEGTTWYTHNLWPAEYWQVWSDFMIHRIHERVLVHIKKLAETSPGSIHAAY